ncbi:MAG: hypothetical protein RIE73_05535 [Coleofasciculus sp. C1-SOL-03]|uniref:hypothetical protein n=1 Tax=Coleofasciculus sp. C1-SOL-03 TaxID=3069522 RepID=UPI0032F76625
MKPRLVVAAVLATSAIATGVVLSSAHPAQSCIYKQSESDQQKEASLDWLRSPWAILITLPGIALATALSRGGRFYSDSEV